MPTSTRAANIEPKLVARPDPAVASDHTATPAAMSPLRLYRSPSQPKPGLVRGDLPRLLKALEVSPTQDLG